MELLKKTPPKIPHNMMPHNVENILKKIVIRTINMNNKVIKATPLSIG